MLVAALMLAQLGIVASAPDTVPIDGYAEVHVRVTARGARAPSVTTPAFPAFLVLRQQSAQHLERDAGGAQMVSELQYTLVPTRAGTFTLPAFVARLGREVARSAPMTIVVAGNALTPGGFVPAIVNRAHIDTTRSVTFQAMALPETVYVGEQATYQLAVFLDGRARSRVRRLEAIAPEMRGLLAYDPPGGLEEYERRGPGRRTFEVHVYQRPVFALGPGDISIPPARLTYAVPVTPSFFAREEHHEARSPAVTIVAIEPPLEGRPPEYDGAVGQLRLSSRLDSGARVGEPITLTVTVSGEGNVKLLPPPRIIVPWANVVRFDDRVRLTSDIQTVRGSKEFEYILTPQHDGPVIMPSLRYAFWDPQSESYKVLESAPETLVVAPGRLARAEAADEPGTRLPIRRVFHGPQPSPWHARLPVWALLALLPVPAVAVMLVRRPRRARRRRSAAIRLRAMRRAPDECDAAALRAVLAEALAERLGLDPIRPRDPDGLARSARRSGVTPETSRRVRQVLSDLESAAFGGLPAPQLADAAAAVAVYQSVDAEAMPRYSPSRRAGVGVIALLIASAGLTTGDALFARLQAPADAIAAPDARARQAFTNGVDAYEMGQFALAERSFSTASELMPRAPDAWANAGTASWALGDTARAVVGWQRALRLEPRANDMRERLELTPAAHAGPEMAVPPLTPDTMLVLGALLWIAGWTAVAYRGWRVQRVSTAFPILGLALLSLASVEPLDRWIGADDLAVSTGDAAPRVRPLLGADAGPRLRTGQLVRVTERDGVWLRVEAGGGRSGWIPANAVLPLARD